MIKKFYDYILSISDLYLLVAIVLFIYGCSSYNEKNAVDWDGLNYAKNCSGDSSTDPECKAKTDSSVDAIGKGGKR